VWISSVKRVKCQCEKCMYKCSVKEVPFGASFTVVNVCVKGVPDLFHTTFVHTFFTLAFDPLHTTDSHRLFYTLTFDPPLHFWLTQRYLSHIDPSLHFWFTQRYLSHIDIWPSLHYWFTQIFFTHWHLTLFTLLIYRDIFFLGGGRGAQIPGI
jgi:hypothetical protein